MAYEKHSWTAAETITAAKLNNLEEGVQTALDQSANVVSESSLTGLRGDINNIQTQVNDLRTSINTKEDTLNSRITNVANSQVSQSDLTNLESRVHNDLITTTSGYDSRISTNAANISTNNATLERHEADIAKISPMQTEITGAHRTQNDTLDARFDDIDISITALQTNLGVASDSTVAATGLHADVEALQAAIGTNEGSSLSGRVTALENTASAIRSEIEGAHTQEYTTLDARFDAVEEKANAAAVASNVTEALSGKQDKITASGLLKGDGNGGVTAAVAGTDYLVQHQDISGKADTSTVITLTNRVTALESRDTEIITVEAFNALNANAENSTKDYLVGPNSTGKYLYYRIIETSTGVYTKVLISSAGSGESGGNTSGMDLTAEEYAALTTYTENTDYYVTREDGVHHYRYVATTPNGELHEIEIGQTLDTNKIKRYNMEKVQDEESKKYYLKLYQYDYDESNNNIDSDLTDIWQWKSDKTYAIDDRVVYNDGYAYKCIVANSDNEWTAANWEKISTICTIQFIELPEGSGGASSGIVRRLVRIGDQIIETIPNSAILLQAFYSYHTTTVDTDGTISSAEPSAGEYTLRLGNTVIDSGTIVSGAFRSTVEEYQENVAGYIQFDVTEYCNTGNNTFELTVTTEGTSQTKNWTVRVFDLRLESTAPEVLLINNTETYSFPYIAFGALNKTLHVIIDNQAEDPISLPSTTSGRSATVVIPAQAHGVHKIKLYLTATIGGIERSTEPDSIIREYIWYDTTNTDNTLILASPYNQQTISTQEYSTIEIPYQVYKKDANSIKVDYYLDDSQVPFDSVTLNDVNTGILSYFADTDGTHTIIIMVDNNIETALTIYLNVAKLDNISPVNDSIINFDPITLTNNSINRLPSWTVGQTTYHLTDSNNFNWSEDSNGGGYKKDEDGKALVIKAGTYIDLDYPIFAGTSNNNVLTRGAELKLIFKTKAVRKADAVWLQSVGQVYEKNVGLQLGVHQGWIKTTRAVDENIVIAPDENGVISINGTNYNIWEPNVAYTIDTIVVLWDETDEDNHQLIFKCIKNWDNTHSSFLNSKGKVETDYWLSMGKINSEVAATDSYLYLSYSEQDKIELDINIDSTAQFIMSYEDGVPSKVYAYSTGTGGDGLYHNNTIRIGSDDCDVYLYLLRIYNKSLTTADILQNFIADGKDIEEKMNRYNRNSIYWDATQNDGKGAYFPTPSDNAILDPIKLAEAMPNVKILMLDTPVFTTSKKNFVMNSSLRCIQADGGNIYTSRGDEDNWLFVNGFHSGQGTTSDNYGQSARNVDFLFEVDAKNWPTKSKNMGTYKPENYPDYKSMVYIGKEASAWNTNTSTWEPTREPKEIEICQDWKGDQCKISLTGSSVPNNYFNLKVNVASSENVNNALFQKRYDDFLVYTSPAQTAQIAKHRLNYEALGQDTTKIKIKNSMEFVPAVLFIRENQQDSNGNPVGHVEFNDCNWHFYALGNIGDSKKTDYTRAYDPDDMNEFTCENSDNNTNNGQFQSGVFNYNGHEAIETNYQGWSETAEYVLNDIVVKDGNIYQCAIANATTGVWNTSEWTTIIYSNWTDNSTTPYFMPRTNPNPMDYIYPISSSQWNVQFNGIYLNRKHQTLVEEEFNGDYSFEFRYACCGDYRDGDLINETEDQDDETQFNLNHDVMLAFYEWVITASSDQFINEAPQWIVKSAMEFFYAYTHYYTMMDNRAKNTFWHFAKTGTYIEVSRPVKELLHVYEESTDNGSTWKKATGTTIDTNKKYRTQYAFDLWAYDMDTAAGIDNNGQLSFPYGKEDDDYRQDGVPTSGYAFNGAGSIFWRRLKTSFTSEIADVMNIAQSCFQSEDLIQEFDNFQNCFPEEIWRLDIERKYIRTFTGTSIDNSITVGKKNPRFLTAMMQGRKKYQRRQWIRNQSLYFNSKYRLQDITVSTNTTEFNVITPANANDPNIAVKPNYDLKLVPYQDMYINVTVGNGGPTPSKRVKAGETYILPIADYTAANFDETRIYIYGFQGISEIGNLASMYPYSFTLNALDHLKKLDIGTDASGYVNANLTSLPFTTDTELPLLESISIKNCHSLSGGLNLNRANNLKTVEAEGTAITGINLPQYTNIETLHLPSTVTDLVLYNARRLVDLAIINNTGNIDYSGLFNLDIYNSDYSSLINWIDIALEMLEKQSLQTRISLLELSTTTIENISTLEPLKDFKTILEENDSILNLSGTINVIGDYSSVEKEMYEATWNNQLKLNIDQATEQFKTKVIYKYDDYLDDNGNKINGEVIKELYINSGSIIPDIVQQTDEISGETIHILDEMPSRAATIKKTYQFGKRESGNYIESSGWKETLGATEPFSTMPTASGDSMTVYTYFEESDTQYQIRWYLEKDSEGNPVESSLVKTSNTLVPYGGGENEKSPTVIDIHNKGLETASVTVNGNLVTYRIFTGWEKLPINITPTVANQPYNIFATWDKQESKPLTEVFSDTSNLTPAQLLVLSALNTSGRSNYANNAASIGVKVSCDLGHDSIESGTEIIGPNATRKILRLDLSTTPVLNTSIQPLASGNDAFTIAIDYCLNENATYNSQISAAIIASCYYWDPTADVTTGFALYHNLNSNINAIGPRVGFGDMLNSSSYSKPVGSSINSGSRNLVVLRHPAGSNTLYIYSTLMDTNGTISPSVITSSITYNNSTSNAYLVFGQLTNDTDSKYNDLRNITTRAASTIYWAKYWDKDLGAGECERIATWPHENVTFAFSSVESSTTTGNRVIGTSAPSPALRLTTLSGSMHGKVIEENASTTIGSLTGWGTSKTKEICNGTLMLGLPIELQSILCKASTAYFNLAPKEDNMMASYSLANTQTSTRDYIAVPSARSLGSKTATTTYDAEENNDNLEPYRWLEDDSRVQIYDYNTGTNSWAENTTESNRAHYLNLRFPGYTLTGSSVNPLRIFRVTTGSISSSSTIYDEINKVGIQTGDVYINTSGKAYVFISNSDINDKGLQREPNAGLFVTPNGGWLLANEYRTRSMGYGSQRVNYIYIKSDGTLMMSETNTASSYGTGLNYSIAI